MPIGESCVIFFHGAAPNKSPLLYWLSSKLGSHTKRYGSRDGNMQRESMPLGEGREKGGNL